MATKLPIVPESVPNVGVEPPVRGEGVLRGIDGCFQRVDALISRVLPESHNPLAQTGALANTTFLIASVTGIVLLIFYRTSVFEAHASVVAMQGDRFLSGFVRTLHRYSSDACMGFVGLHAAKLFCARRFGGARWVAWVTGIVLLASLWLVGWLGYWLVWDERAKQVALGTARLLDALPIFADPFSRSFLSDSAVSSLFFFVVLFVHMLLPLAMGVALWIHITRLSRSWFLTKRTMTIWVVGTLSVLSWALPADVAGPAKMAVHPAEFAIDGWYLLPLALTDRLGGGALWAIVVVSTIVLLAVPWALVRGRVRPAAVVESRCNACETCYRDCPYNAIAMVPRTDGSDKYATVAQVDPAKCIGCGICAGSCDSAGVGLPWFDTLHKRKELDERLDAAMGRSPELHVTKPPIVVFGCAESALSGLSVDAGTGRARLAPDCIVVPVPCAGWVHALTVERAFRHGASHVAIVTCGEGSEMYREGHVATVERMNQRRAPFLNLEKVDPERVFVLPYFKHQAGALLSVLLKLETGGSPSTARRTTGVQRGLALAFLGLALAAITYLGSVIPYCTPPRHPELVVTFKHPGQIATKCRELSEAEKAKLPPHMRQGTQCDRGRAPVRLRVWIDGTLRHSDRYDPKGIWGDGNSLAIVRLPVEAGTHDVRVELGDTPEPDQFDYSEQARLAFVARESRVVTFSKLSGFQFH